CKSEQQAEALDAVHAWLDNFFGKWRQQLIDGFAQQSLLLNLIESAPSRHLLATLGPDYLCMDTIRNQYLQETLGHVGDTNNTETGGQDGKKPENMPLHPDTLQHMAVYRALYDHLPSCLSDWLLDKVFGRILLRD